MSPRLLCHLKKIVEPALAKRWNDRKKKISDTETVVSGKKYVYFH